MNSCNKSRFRLSFNPLDDKLELNDTYSITRVISINHSDVSLYFRHFIELNGFFSEATAVNSFSKAKTIFLRTLTGQNISQITLEVQKISKAKINGNVKELL